MDMIPLEDQIAELRREFAIRERVYPKWVEQGRMKQEQADLHQARMAAAIETLGKVRFGVSYAEELNETVERGASGAAEGGRSS